MAYINGKKVLSVVRTEFIPALYQEKTITPQNQTHEITADNGYAGLSKVILNGLLVDPHHNYTTQTDNTIAYQKSVPSGALKYAILGKLGGMSYKSENLIVGNKHITLTAGSNKWYDVGNVNVEIGNSYTIKCFNTQQSNELLQVIMGDNYLTNNDYPNAYTFTATTTTIGIRIGRGTLNNDIDYDLKIMLVKGSTAPTEYKPYFENIRDSAVTSIVARKGALSGLRLTQIGAVDLGSLNWGDYETQTSYRFSTSALVNVIAKPTSSSVVANIYCEDYETKSADDTYIGVVGISVDTTGNLWVYDTTYGQDPQAFKQALSGVYLYYELATELSTPQQKVLDYFVTDTKQIPSEIQSLNGYGWGINSSVYNYIDFENKKFIQKVGRVDLGTYTYTPYSGNIFSTSTIANAKKPTSNNDNANILNAKYTSTNANAIWIGFDKGISINTSGQCQVKDTSYNDETTFKTAMSGVYLYYELATPIETDISQYLDDNYIEVEGNGSLTFTNQYEQAVPSDVTYLVEVSNE